MPMVSVEIMKTIDEKKTTKEKQTKTERSKDRNYSERVRAKWFCYAFKKMFIVWLKRVV